MRITIAERLKPYQHTAGTRVLIPSTSTRATIYPALVRFDDLSHAEPKLLKETAVPILGPVKDFTVQQDLEKGILWVWGFGKEGYFRYAVTQDLQIVFEKEKQASAPETSRLSLGNHKAQDWSLVKRRLDLTEVFPIWLRLGELTKKVKPTDTGTGALLKQCKDYIADNKRLEIIPAFTSLFLAGFEGLMSPRLMDAQHQGFNLPMPESTASPLSLLSDGAVLIQSLFFQQEGKRLSILPVLPPEFHSGRFIRYHWKGYGLLDIEWSKKLIKKVILHAESDASIDIAFQKEIKSFRLNGTVTPINESIAIQAGQIYFFDRFTK